MNLNKLSWKYREIELNGRSLNARISRLNNWKELSYTVYEQWRPIVSEGGGLFHHIVMSELVEVRIPGLSHLKCFKQSESPNVYELWHLPSCSFEDLLELAWYLSFPSEKKYPGVVNRDPIIKYPEELFNNIKKFLLQYHKHKPLTITQIESDYIMLNIVSPSDVMEQCEADQICAFNEKYFRKKYVTKDDLEQTLNWMDGGFFTIGI